MSTTQATPPGESNAQSTADLGAIASDLAGTMPDVQQHAVDMAAQEMQARASSQVDKAGAAFDSSVHVVGADGKGMLTVRGTWAQKRGRKAGNATTVNSGTKPGTSVLGGPGAPLTPQAAQAQQLQHQEAQSRQAGVAAAEMLFMAGRAIGGEEWEPAVDTKIGLDERAMMRQAFGDYFVASGKTDIPPGTALTFCIIAYAAPRFAMPKTQSRFARVKGAIVTWWTNRKLRKAGYDVQVQQKPTEPEKK